MGGDSAVSMFAMLMDRSVQRIREIAADPRHFDRGEVARIADVWDNNTGHFFGILQAWPGWRRDTLARKALRWMAESGPQRRAWMVDHGGEPMRRVLGPERSEALFHRDYQGHVVAGLLPLSGAGLDVDYDLDRAQATVMRVERSGTGFEGLVALRVPRRYADGDCLIQLHLSGVRAAEFGGIEVPGVRIVAGPAGVDLRVGAGTTFVAGGAEVWMDDRLWHLSAGGRAADAITPAQARYRRREPIARPRGAAYAAMAGFHEAMLQIRRVRSEPAVARVPIVEWCDVVASAGSRAIAAARTDGFAGLARQWTREIPGRGVPVDRIPDEVVLTLASCSPKPEKATVNFAEPVAEGWRLGAAVLSGSMRVTLAGGALKSG
jgi:hypothetical protein